ncbi:MAG: gamma carbonic anhydrase family protein [Deltaproteobacteria bacterium]|nr:gamma carbonic anhydrase family protein [Deltaproteobacteria bacterium]
MIRPFRGKSPAVPEGCFVDASAQVLGDVVMGEGSSVWMNAVIRGDVQPVRIGARTNIQDLSLVHVQSRGFATHIGDDVTVGHHVVLHGCSVGNRVLVGMGAILLDGVKVGDGCIIAAGALLTPGTEIPPGHLVLGSPGKVKRPLTDAERAFLLESARTYAGYAREYLQAFAPVL